MSDNEKIKKMRRRRKWQKRISGSFLAAAIGAGVGGYLDLANNTDEPSTENSNPNMVARYEQEIAQLSELKADRSALREASFDFFSAVYTNNQISEADVAKITAKFTEEIAPPAAVLGSYVLEHPEYLDEAKSMIKSRSLGALDQKTMDIHNEAYNDSALGGAVLGFFGANIVLSLTFGVLNLLGSVASTGANAASRKTKKLRDKIKSKPPRFKH